MKKSKYVIVDSFGLELPIIFNPIIDHSAVCQTLPVVSAGFCEREEFENVYTVWGESISLKKKSRPQDAIILMDAMQIEI